MSCGNDHMNFYQFMYRMAENHPVVLIIMIILFGLMMTDVYKFIVDLVKQ